MLINADTLKIVPSKLLKGTFMAKVVKPLSPMQVKNAKQQDRPYKLADGGGMYMLISKGLKYWRMDYRFEGKRKKLPLVSALNCY